MLLPIISVLHFYISSFGNTCAVPSSAVLCSSLMSCLAGMLCRYFLNHFEMVPVARIITGTISVFKFHIHCMSIPRSLYFKTFSAAVLFTFLSPEIAVSIDRHVSLSQSRNMTSDCLLRIVL